MTIQIKTSEQYFPVVLFIYRVVLTFHFVGGILNCDHSNESSSVYFAVEGSFNFESARG